MSVEYDILEQIRSTARWLIDSFPGMPDLWILGDVNRDGKIDKDDLAAINAAFGTKPGDPRWNPDADLNQDHVIDVEDSRICAAGQGLGLKQVAGPIPGLPSITPLMDINRVWDTGFIEAKETQTLYQQHMVGAAIADFFGGDLGINVFGMPGWRARIDRAVQIFNAPFDFGAVPLLKSVWQGLYVPFVPQIRELTQLLIRRQISPGDYPFFAALNGFAGRWAVGLLEAAYQLPDPDTLKKMLWRGLVDPVGFQDLLLKSGVHPDLIDELLALAWEIPGYGDLTKLMVREIITPEQFLTFMAKQGFTSFWAASLYEAHFRLPSPEHLTDAFHRGRITEAELNKYVFWHDYKPDPRAGIEPTDIEIMASVRKTLIPRVDLRRAWLLGELTDAELITRYGWLGYEEDSELMATIQKAIGIRPETNQVRNIWLRALRQGVKTEAQVISRLRSLKVPRPAIDLLIEAENVRREIGAVEIGEEPRVLSTSHITALFKRRLIDRPAAALMLAALGWDPGAADMLLLLSDPGPEENAPLTAVKSAASTLYREGYLAPDLFEALLRAANYTEADISNIRQSEDLRYLYDFLKDLQAADIAAYRGNILTLSELEDRLLSRGMQPERAAALVAKEAYKLLPKRKELI